MAPLSGFGLPIGGQTFANMSAEARVPIWGNLSGVLFVDAGNVWTDPWDFNFKDLHYDVGPGLRYNTPIGPIRADFGYQLNAHSRPAGQWRAGAAALPLPLVDRPGVLKRSAGRRARELRVLESVRRVLQVVALVGTLLVGIVALALIVSQTPWFRDWLRRYIVRESKQYLNGELSIGRHRRQPAVRRRGQRPGGRRVGVRVIAVKAVEVDYNVFQIVSKGVVLNEIKLVEPAIVAGAGSERLESRAAGEGAGEGGGPRKDRGSRSSCSRSRS